MTRYSISKEIASPIERVWQVLTREMPADPDPFGILRLEGNIAQGAKIKLWSEVDPKRAFALKVTTFDAPRRMVWTGGMPFGLFTGVRTFSLSSVGARTRFDMSEEFSGLMSTLIVRSIPDLTPSFETFAQALRERALKEQAPAGKAQTHE